MLVRSWGPLTLDYLPKELLFRETEIERIRRFLSPRRGPKSGVPSTMVIDGLTGTGKTATVRWVLERGGAPRELASAYVSAKDVTTYDALVGIASSLGLLPRGSRGLGSREVGELIERYAKTRDVLVVLDEVDRIRVRSLPLDNFLALLMRAEGVRLVLVTNKLGWSDLNVPGDLKPYILSKARFDPYNADQLAEILLKRAEEAFLPGSWEEGAIRRIAALVAQETGSAKEALRLLRIAAEIAESKGDTKLTEEHVVAAEKEDEVRSVQEALANVPIQGRIILEVLLESGEMDSSELYLAYARRAETLGVRVLSKPSFFKVLDTLDRNFLVELRQTRARGRPYRVSLSVDRDLLESALGKP